MEHNNLTKGVSFSKPPIFIVGGSRSGTSLLAAMLNAHSQIACGPETQLLKKTQPKQLEKIISDSDWPNKAVEHLSQIVLAEQKVIDIYDTSPEELRSGLSVREPGIAALFEALVGTYAKKRGKLRWAEKTPRHLLYLNLLRSAFPKAKIIRILRDPRDSAISMCQLPWASKSMLVNFYLCCKWFDYSNPFFEVDQNAITIKYEDLVENPEDVLRFVCDFIDETFETNMLDPSSSARDVVTPNETWKRLVTTKLSSDRLYRWKKELPRLESIAASYIGGSWLAYFKYEVSIKPLMVFTLFNFQQKDLEIYINDILTCANKKMAFRQTETLLDHNKTIFILNLDASLRVKRKLYTRLVFRQIMLKKSFVLLTNSLRPGWVEKVLLYLFSVKSIYSLEEL